MLINETTALVGDKVVLVPYRASHVPRYHEWMSDPAVREATASEELTLEEEYEMQASWRVDEDKLTFIILSRDSSVAPTSSAFFATHDTSRMVGDVNIFLSLTSPSDDEDEDSPDPARPAPPPPTQRCEVEIMVALTSSRRQGYAFASLKHFLQYASAILSLPPSAFFARISTSNEGSIALFERLGFKRGKVVEVFAEMEMVWGGGDGWGWEKDYQVVECPVEAV